MAWQTRQPCLHRVDALTNTGEAEAVNDPLDRPDFFLDPCAALIGDRDRRGQITEANMIAAERLQGEVGVNDLVVGVAVEKLRGLVVDQLAQTRRTRLAIVEPLPAQFGPRLGGESGGRKGTDIG